MAKKTIETGIRKPADKGRGTKVPNPIPYGIQNPSSDFDKRAEQGTVQYVGPSKVEDRSSKIGAGNSQKKKHVSSGKGQ